MNPPTGPGKSYLILAAGVATLGGLLFGPGRL